MADNSRQAFGLKILKNSHKKIRKLRKAGYEAEIHGNKFWNSSFLVMDYLKRHPLPKKARVLEIGCGWGLLGLYCADRFNARVTGIDADKNVFPYLDLHADINGVSMKREKKTFKQLSVDYLSEFDYVLGADICFWDEMTGQLLSLIKRARKAGVHQVMIADPCRPPFNQLAKKAAKTYGDQAQLEEIYLKRPGKVSGDLLIVTH